MKIAFGIGTATQNVEVSDRNLLGVLAPKQAEPSDEQAALKYALENPVGAAPLWEIVHPGEKIAIVTSDITRPMPTYKVLPAVLEELGRVGVSDRDITVVFGLGSHRGHTEEERRHLLGDAYGTVACQDSGAKGFVNLGTTSRGTPVEIDRTVAEADRRICLGNIEFHYFAGYSGGAKAIMPGVSTRAAIQANHRFMVDHDACARRIEGNPIREDIEEAAALVGVDFILNVILNPRKEILHAVAGDVRLAHRAGCAVLDSLYLNEIPCQADIVIVSQGGAPKDLNLYQTQKALDNAKYAVRDGGIIILVGSCREGLGEATFEQWIMEADTPDAIIERLAREFRLGGHKAAAIALVLKRANIYLVSDLEPSLVRSIFMKPFETVEQAYAAARQQLGQDATVLAMPFGGSTLPCVKEN